MKRLIKTSRAALLAACLTAAAAGPVSAQALLAGERPATVAAIPGVVDAGAKWEIVTASFNNLDGIVGMADGGVLFAQEQTNSIRRLDAAGHETVYVADTHGAGAVSLDSKGRLYAVQRTCTDPGLHLGPACLEQPMVSQLLPERRMLTNTAPDGKPLGRVNDIVADGKGGAYFTVGGAYYVNAEGVVSVVADKDIRSNGIMLSRDGKTLYVTNNTNVLAFEVQADGTTRNRRVFGDLGGDMGGDGMAIDGAGRLYVSGAAGVHVLSPEGAHLGLIPTPRRPISVAFSGPDKKTLFVIQNGAVGPDGRDWKTPDGIRNTAMSLYKLPMVAEGFKGRAK